MNSKQGDHLLLKLKDVCLLLIAVGAIGSWVIGITQVPPKVEAHETDIKELKVYASNNEVFVQGLQKDINSMRSDLSEIKHLLKRRLPDA